ncbi:MAG: hypothetical protein VKK98_06665 [Cyanobacteriota bacterium]|nr:hypothetical protein [Cyanobacteriota bacterium]
MPRWLLKRLAAAGLGVQLLAGCGEAPLPQRQLRSDDCLRELKIENLAAQIARCDDVVARFPNLPAPLNERYLLLSLAGRDQEACRDIRRAHDLARRSTAEGLDEQLKGELKLRTELCNRWQRHQADNRS